MFDFFAGQVWFLVTLLLVLWLPGRMGVFFLERKKRFLTMAERVAVTVTLSIVIVDFLMIVLGRMGMPLEALTVGTGIVLVSGILWGLAKWGSLGVRRSVETQDVASLQVKKSISPSHPSGSLVTSLASDSGKTHHLPPTPPSRRLDTSPQAVEDVRGGRQRRNFSPLFLVVFILAVAIKLIYLVPNMVPTSTDLGHHTFWIEKIVQEKKLPVYQEQEIEKDANGKNIVGEALPISDFIEGEHLMLSAVLMISGKEPVSAFAITTLFCVHIATLFAMYALARRLFEKFAWSESVGVWTLFFFGVLYALGQSQLRYVTGGAVGNVLGNLLIPTAFLLLIFSVRRKRTDLLIAAIVVMFGLVYTHHLSTLMFVFGLLGTLIALVLLNRKIFIQSIFPMLQSRAFLGTIILLGLFFFFVYAPAYIRNMAVTSVVGAPEAVEHLGFSFLQLAGAVGEPRMVLALAGLIFLFLSIKLRRSDVLALLLGWTVPLAFLVLYPDIAQISLPSARVANYIVFPLSILSGYAIVMLVRKLKRYGGLSPKMIGAVVLFVVVAVSYRGFFDNDLFLKMRPNQTERALELFSASKYLSRSIPSDVVVMHDHINIPGDSWIKIFFLRDYNYPFYRALLFRYDRASDKQEKCTLQIFSASEGKEAKQCAEDLNVRAVLVDEKIDGQQFQHFKNYWKVYSDPFHSVYVRSGS